MGIIFFLFLFLYTYFFILEINIALLAEESGEKRGVK